MRELLESLVTDVMYINIYVYMYAYRYICICVYTRIHIDKYIPDAGAVRECGHGCV